MYLYPLLYLYPFQFRVKCLFRYQLPLAHQSQDKCWFLFLPLFQAKLTFLFLLLFQVMLRCLYRYQSLNHFRYRFPELHLLQIRVIGFCHCPCQY